MNLKFTKMHGAGNDFIVIDAIHQSVVLTAAQCRLLADRRFGIGADQILVVQPPTDSTTDFTYRIFNADGGEVEQCGNGARAFVRFVIEKKLTTKSTIKVATLGGVIAPSLSEDGNITVDMGPPEFAVDRIPFDSGGLQARIEADELLWPIDVKKRTAWISVVSMGNPHAVQIVDDVEATDVEGDGAVIETHHRFIKRVNAGFMQILSQSHIKLRVFERGAGETLACGTGACAAVVAGIRRGRLTSPVRVNTRGGELVVAWQGDRSSVWLSGPAVTVFEGEICL